MAGALVFLVWQVLCAANGEMQNKHARPGVVNQDSYPQCAESINTLRHPVHFLMPPIIDPVRSSREATPLELCLVRGGQGGGMSFASCRVALRLAFLAAGGWTHRRRGGAPTRAIGECVRAGARSET